MEPLTKVRKDSGVFLISAPTHARSTQQVLVTKYAKTVDGVVLIFPATRARSARHVLVANSAITVV